MTCAESIQTILQDGTWTNYGSVPDVLVLQKTSKRGSINKGITLRDIDETPIYAYNNVKIYDEQTSCELELYTSNNTNRDNIFKDIKAIFLASSNRPIIKNPKPIIYRNKKIYRMTVILIP